jgi:hypothetical protein
VGSRSAPIGTPPALKFPTLNQRITPDLERGPGSVLKHSRSKGFASNFPVEPKSSPQSRKFINSQICCASPRE